MTLYAYDSERETVVAVWEAGEGRRAVDAVPVRPGSAVAGRQLALALELLSRQLWHDYVHPPSAAPSLERNTEGWRRERRREDFDEVVAVIRNPHLPSGGLIIQASSPLEEAHQLGRMVRTAGNVELEHVVAEVQRELDAIEQAELGAFGGRAAQALGLSRADASPSQVARAHELLRADPLTARLSTELDPTSAAVAVAEWLVGAVEVAADSLGIEPIDVIVEADSIIKQDIDTPTIVISRLLDGEDATAVVVDLVRRGVEVGAGETADLEDFIADLRARDHAARHRQAGTLRPREEPDPVRVAVVDPSRPAPSLCDALMEAVRACALVYDDEPDGEPTNLDDLDDLDTAAARDESFIAALRAHMELDQ